MDWLLGIFLSAIFGIAPMVLFAGIVTRFDRYEKEPGMLMLFVFLWGFVVAASAALILNTTFGIGVFLITGNQNFADATTAVLFAPVVEESVKGLAVLLVFLYFRNEFNTVLDGIIYGGLVGFGFAAAENTLYIFSGYSMAGLEGLLSVALLRVLLIPFLHAAMTSFTGIGLAVGRLSKNRLKTTAPFAGFFFAILFHSSHNLLSVSGLIPLEFIGFLVDWTGVFALLFFISYLLRSEKQVMQKYLREEVNDGNMTSAQYDSAVSQYRKTIACWTCMDRERRRKIAEFYDLAARLAFKKREKELLGPEPGSERDIMEMRNRIRLLGREIRTVN